MGKQRVALVVFAEVEADDPSVEMEPYDAAVVLKSLLKRSVAFGPSAHNVVWPSNKVDHTVVIHEAVELGMACGNGHLWTGPTDKAFRGKEWQRQVEEEELSWDAEWGTGDVHPTDKVPEQVRQHVEEMISTDVPSETLPESVVKQLGPITIPTVNDTEVVGRAVFPTPQPGIAPDPEFDESPTGEFSESVDGD